MKSLPQFLIRLVRVSSAQLLFVLGRNRRIPLRIVLSAGGQSVPSGWLATEHKFLDLTDEASWRANFPFGAQIEAAVAEHVFEHLELPSIECALGHLFDYMVDGARLRIAVPDGFHPHKDYIEHVKPGGIGPGAEDHRVLLNYQSLKQLIEAAGFRAVLLEWYDRTGHRNSVKWDPSEGVIHRSDLLGNPDASFPGSHQSLIIDALK